MTQYPIRLQISYQKFNEIVKNINTCCAFYDNKYHGITPRVIDKLIKEDFLIAEYHDTPLGEVIYLVANSKLN